MIDSKFKFIYYVCTKYLLANFYIILWKLVLNYYAVVRINLEYPPPIVVRY